jgi:hypothetical protein
MRLGDLVRFKTHDHQVEWYIGLLLRYDKFTKVAEIMVGEHLYYAPGRLVNTHQRGRRHP